MFITSGDNTMFMKKIRPIVFFVFVMVMLLPVQLASAGFYYEDSINVSEDFITATITDMYTDGHAYRYRMEMSGMDGTVNESDYITDMANTKKSLNVFLTEYLKVDNINPIVFDFKVEAPDALGEVTNESLKVTRHIVYKLPESLGTGEHVIWVMGNPDIEKRLIVLPEGVTLDSAKGLKDMQQTETEGRIVLSGISATSKYMNGTIQTFEYATVVTFSKKPWYFNRLVLPLLILLEGLLAIAALYSIRGILHKSSNE